MNEVCYSVAEKKLVNEYEKQEVKKSDDWSMEKYVALRKSIKDHYLKEQDYTCCFCQQRIVVTSNRAWDVEHIICKKLFPNFMFVPMNLCVSCPDCNNAKNDQLVLDRGGRKRFPRTSGAYKTFHPILDKYDDHIEVVVAGQLYRYHTKKGKMTISVYGLQRFMKATNRNRSLSPDDKVKTLYAKAMLATGDEYEKCENKILEALTIKRAKDIGHKRAIEVLDALNSSR